MIGAKIFRLALLAHDDAGIRFLQGGKDMYKYETHLHTYPVSRCAKVGVEEMLAFYKQAGYDGVFITNHFLDGNINFDTKAASYEDAIHFYFSDYEKALEVGKEIGLKVFCGVEMGQRGTHFLVYGLDKDWYLAHPEIVEMKQSEELAFLRENGALIIQAHPYREERFIDHIRLFPRHVHGVEIINAVQSEFVNNMGRLYAESYGLIKFAGSDNHWAGKAKALAGMQSPVPIKDEQDFIEQVKNGNMETFSVSLIAP